MLSSSLETKLVGRVEAVSDSQVKSRLTYGDIFDEKLREIDEPLTMYMPLETMTNLNFSPIKQHLIAYSSENTVKVMNLFTKQEVLYAPALVNCSRVLKLTFNYKFIVFTSDNEAVTIWDLKSDSEYLTVNCVEIVNAECSDSGKFLVLGCKNSALRVWDVYQKSEVLFLEKFGVPRVFKFFKERYLGAGMENGEIVLWELKNMSEFYRYKAHSVGILDFQFSPFNTSIISSSSTHIFLAHNYLSSKFEYVLPASKNEPFSIRYSPSGTFAALSFPSCITCYNLQTYSSYFQIPTSSIPLSYSISDCGQYLAHSYQDSPVTLTSLQKSRSSSKPLKISNKIHSLIFTPDNQYIISGCNDNTIKKWDSKTLQESFSLLGHTSQVNSLGISVCGKYLVSGSSDSSVKVWDLSTNLEEFSLAGHKNEVLAVGISLNSVYIASGCRDGLMKIWNFSDRTEASSVDFQSGYVSCLKFVPDSRFVVSACQDCKLRIWNVSERRVEGTLSGHSRKITKLDITSDSKLLVSGSKDYKIIIWNLQEHRLDITLQDHTDCITDLRLFSNNEYLASVSKDCSLKIWNIPDKRAEFTISAHSTEITALGINSNNTQIVTVDANCQVQILDLLTKGEKYNISTDKNTVNSVAISPLTNLWACGLKDSSIKFWDVGQGTLQFTLSGHSDSVNGLSFSGSGSLLASASSDKTVRIWDLDTKTAVVTFDGHKDAVFYACFSNSEHLVASCSDDQQIKIWNLSSASEELSLIGHSSSVYSIKFTSDDCHLVSGSWDRTVKVWDLKEKKLDFSLSGHTASINSVDVTFDKQYIVTGSDDRTIKVWNFNEKREEFTLTGHENYVYSVCVCPKGKYLVSGSADKTVKIWNLFEKREEFTLLGHDNTINSVSISADCEYVASGSDDCTVKLWNIRSVYKEPQGVSLLYFISDEENDAIVQETVDWVKVFTRKARRGEEEVEKFNWRVVEDFQDNAEIWLDFQEILRFKACPAYDQIMSILQSDRFLCSINDLLDILQNFQEYSIGPGTCLDPYFQPIYAFYNLIESISCKNFENFNQAGTNLVFSEYSYTVLHYWAHTGNIESLSASLTPSSSVLIRTDLFGKSPIYYSILKKYQKCTDLFLNYFLSIEEKGQSFLFTSIFATRNDFQQIIKNSSKLLPAYLNLCLFSSNYLTIPNVQLPIFHYFSRSSLPQLHDFIVSEHSADNMPAIFKHLAFKIPSTAYSSENIEFLFVLGQCKNDQIFKTQLVQYVVDIQWEIIKFWAYFYSLVLLLNLVNFIVLVALGGPEFYFVVSFCVINLFLIMWEIIQVQVCGVKEYVKDLWNLVDFLQYLIVPLWIVLDVWGFRDQIVSSLAAFIVLTRGLTAFKIFDGTRYYLRLILRSLNNIKFFMVMFFYSTFFFGVLFMVARGESANVDGIWTTSWQLNFGESSDTLPEKTNLWLNYIITMLATITNVVLMLNLLISILGDSYDQFQIEKTLIDYREKLEYIIEIQKIIFWKRCPGNSEYLHILTSPFDEEELNDWEGRVLYMEQKQEKSLIKLQKSIDKKLEKSEHSTIESVKQNISQVETKILRVEKKLDTKVERIENKLAGIEGKMQKFDNKFEAIDSNLQKILEALNK